MRSLDPVAGFPPRRPALFPPNLVCPPVPRAFRPAVVVALALLACAGCRPANDRYGLTGTVQFRGKPVNSGTIRFMSVERTPGETAGALIVNGQYDVPAAKGLPTGKYRVVISCPVRPSGIPPDVMYTGQYNELLPATVNTASTLTVEVTAREPNRFDFSIP